MSEAAIFVSRDRELASQSKGVQGSKHGVLERELGLKDGYIWAALGTGSTSSLEPNSLPQRVVHCKAIPGDVYILWDLPPFDREMGVRTMRKD